MLRNISTPSLYSTEQLEALFSSPKFCRSCGGRPTPSNLLSQARAVREPFEVKNAPFVIAQRGTRGRMAGC